MSSSLQFPINKPLFLCGKCYAVSCKPNSSSHFKLRLAERSIKCGFGKEYKDETELPGVYPEVMPKHVAVIMDGNRRWARNRSLPAQLGRKAMKQLTVNCKKYGVKILSVFAFSTENWARPKEEVDFLISLFQDAILSEIEELIQEDVRVTFVGNRSRFPESLQKLISMVEERGKGNQAMHLVIALNYSGRYDITEAAKKIATMKDELCEVEDIDETIVEQHLETSGVEFPNVDMMIRTSGELRVSNFMLWQLAYTEMFFTNKLFPDFDEADLLQAFTAFQQRSSQFAMLVSFLGLKLYN